MAVQGGGCKAQKNKLKMPGRVDKSIEGARKEAKVSSEEKLFKEKLGEKRRKSSGDL